MLGTYHTGTTGEYPDEERTSLKREVHGLLEDAGTKDWDDEGALALAPETVAIAQKLIDEFPPLVGKPDVAATPHGEVDFDWVIARKCDAYHQRWSLKGDCIRRVVSWRTFERLRTMGRHAAAICELLL